MFPGLIYRPSDLPIVLLIFYSGKVVITGAKYMLDVYQGWEKVLKLLQNFVTEKDTDKNNVSAGSLPQLNL
jgi:transcription initiation factor TFIID TATA-box-binding protein